jgi:uncharacterized repeat protein (TIGR03943 family)
MTVMRRIPALLEAACLIGLAGFLAYLLVAGNYWMYLNPKFRGLSWAAVAALAGLGIYSAVRPPAGATWLRASLYLSVLGLCLMSELGLQRWFAASGVDSQAVEEAQAPLPSRVTVSGVEYVRINLGELYDIAGKGPSPKLRENYAVRGFVRRSPEADAKGEFVLYRLALYCCFADSTAVGFRVRPPKGAALPENGSWQVVYGALETAADPDSDKIATIEGSAFASVNPDYRLEAKRMEPEKAPGMGMMYEWHPEEPYAY